MKCEIIQDLFPSYLDHLTSGESNAVIEEHLAHCKTCQNYYAEMKQELNTKENVTITKNNQDIRAFKKINIRIYKIVAVTIVLCVLAFGGVTYYFNY